MSRDGPTLVILAAGASSRLGTCKALAQLGPRTALEHLLAAGSCLTATPPIVVSGRHHEQLAAALPPGVQLVHNPTWELGRTGSLQAACAAAPGRDLCVAPVDVPLVPGAVFEALALAWAAAGSPARGWLAPHWEPPPREPVAGEPGPPSQARRPTGPTASPSASPTTRPAGRPPEAAAPRRFGHPILLGRALLAAVLEAPPDRELRSFRSLAAPIWSIPVPGTEILDDLDTLDDLRRLRHRLTSTTPPDPSPN